MTLNHVQRESKQPKNCSLWHSIVNTSWIAAIRSNPLSHTISKDFDRSRKMQTTDSFFIYRFINLRWQRQNCILRGSTFSKAKLLGRNNVMFFEEWTDIENIWLQICFNRSDRILSCLGALFFFLSCWIAWFISCSFTGYKNRVSFMLILSSSILSRAFYPISIFFSQIILIGIEHIAYIYFII